MSARPTKLPRWAVDLSQNLASNMVEPAPGEKDTGFVHAAQALSTYFNWLFAYVYLWLQYISDGVVSFVDVATTTLEASGQATLATLSSGASTLASLVVTGVAQVGALLTANGGITVPNSQAATFHGSTTLGDTSSDAVTVNATTAFAGPTNSSGTATFNGAVVANGNVTLGDAAGDTLTVNATSSIAGPATFNANATVATGKTLTMTDGAGALKNMSTIRIIIPTPGMFNTVTNTVGSNAATAAGVFFGINWAGDFYLNCVATHETITGIVLTFRNTPSGLGSLTLKAIDSSGTGAAATVTGLSFPATSGTSGGTTWTKWTMTGTPSVPLKPSGNGGFQLSFNNNGGSNTELTSIAVTVTT